MSHTSNLVQSLKESGQDFEFYPTTPEIIEAVVSDMFSRNRYGAASVLDIGAGDGRVLRAFRDAGVKNLYGIEKSPVLIGELSRVALVIGTDFHAQSLVDKVADIVFCNPPYSEHEAWLARIVRECGSQTLYFVVPSRWTHSDEIRRSMDERKAKPHVIGSYDFATADRKARAHVDLVRIDCETTSSDVFDRFFETAFGDLTEKLTDAHTKIEEAEANDKRGIMEQEAYIPALVTQYDYELRRIKDNYRKVATLDLAVLRELSITVESIKTLLKAKLAALTESYWRQLLDKTKTVMERLTYANRNAILERLKETGTVDFTVANAYAILTWILENANQYVDNQVLALFDRLARDENIRAYKSNQKVFDASRHRYYREEREKMPVRLDYRLVVSGCGLDDQKFEFSRNHLRSCGTEFVRDLFIVAKSFGYVGDFDDPRLDRSHNWVPNASETFTAADGTIILEVKAFRNGNLHIRMGQRLSLLLNIAVGKLRGWLHNAAQAAEELEDPEAAEVFDVSHRIGKALLLTCAADG